MTLRTFIDAIESAAGKRDASELTDIEKIALCINSGVEMIVESLGGRGQYDIGTACSVGFKHDGGNWQVIELK